MEEEMIKDIKDRLSEGEELRDVARRYGMSCRMICRLVAKAPEEDSLFSDSFEVDNSKDEPVTPLTFNWRV